jgi:glycosyltransferase involved in cell wall biosynthesis
MTMPDRRGAPLHTVQVSFHADHERRDPAALLEAWPTLPSVASATVRAGVRVTVVQTAHRDETIERDGVQFHFVRDDSRLRRRVVARVASISADVIHAHGFHNALAVRALSRATTAPVLVQDHAGVAPTGWRRSRWSWAFAKIAGAAFTVAEHAVPWRDARVLPDDVPVFEVLAGSSSFSPGDRKAAQRMTNIFGDPCVLSAGHLNPNKDPLMMLDAFERVVPRLPDARLWCCFGEAPMLDVVRARIDASPALRSRVTLLGRREHAEMQSLHRAANFFVQTSHREGCGYSLLEAMSCGTIPIVTDIPAARFIVGKTGSLTPVGDAAAMADALVSWAARDRTVAREAVRTRFAADLTLDAIGRQLRHAYESVAACAF